MAPPSGSSRHRPAAGAGHSDPIFSHQGPGQARPAYPAFGPADGYPSPAYARAGSIQPHPASYHPQAYAYGDTGSSDPYNFKGAAPYPHGHLAALRQREFLHGPPGSSYDNPHDLSYIQPPPVLQYYDSTYVPWPRSQPLLRQLQPPPPPRSATQSARSHGRNQLTRATTVQPAAATAAARAGPSKQDLDFLLSASKKRDDRPVQLAKKEDPDAEHSNGQTIADELARAMPRQMSLDPHQQPVAPSSAQLHFEPDQHQELAAEWYAEPKDESPGLALEQNGEAQELPDAGALEHSTAPAAGENLAMEAEQLQSRPQPQPVISGKAPIRLHDWQIKLRHLPLMPPLHLSNVAAEAELSPDRLASLDRWIMIKGRRRSEQADGTLKDDNWGTTPIFALGDPPQAEDGSWRVATCSGTVYELIGRPNLEASVREFVESRRLELELLGAGERHVPEADDVELDLWRQLVAHAFDNGWRARVARACVAMQDELERRRPPRSAFKLSPRKRPRVAFGFDGDTSGRVMAGDSDGEPGDNARDGAVSGKVTTPKKKARPSPRSASCSSNDGNAASARSSRMRSASGGVEVVIELPHRPVSERLTSSSDSRRHSALPVKMTSSAAPRSPQRAKPTTPRQHAASALASGSSLGTPTTPSGSAAPVRIKTEADSQGSWLTKKIPRELAGLMSGPFGANPSAKRGYLQGCSAENPIVLDQDDREAAVQTEEEETLTSSAEPLMLVMARRKVAAARQPPSSAETQPAASSSDDPLSAALTPRSPRTGRPSQRPRGQGVAKLWMYNPETAPQITYQREQSQQRRRAKILQTASKRAKLAPADSEGVDGSAAEADDVATDTADAEDVIAAADRSEPLAESSLQRRMADAVDEARKQATSEGSKAMIDTEPVLAIPTAEDGAEGDGDKENARRPGRRATKGPSTYSVRKLARAQLQKQPRPFTAAGKRKAKIAPSRPAAVKKTIADAAAPVVAGFGEAPKRRGRPPNLNKAAKKAAKKPGPARKKKAPAADKPGSGREAGVGREGYQEDDDWEDALGSQDTSTSFRTAGSSHQAARGGADADDADDGDGDDDEMGLGLFRRFQTISGVNREDSSVSLGYGIVGDDYYFSD